MRVLGGEKPRFSAPAFSIHRRGRACAEKDATIKNIWVAMGVGWLVTLSLTVRSVERLPRLRKGIKNRSLVYKIHYYQKCINYSSRAKFFFLSGTSPLFLQLILFVAKIDS